MNQIYNDRCYSAGYPDLEKLGVEFYRGSQVIKNTTLQTMECIGKLISLNDGLRTVAVIGCGPNPVTVRDLCSHGYDAVGVEPVAGSADAAAVFLGDSSRVRHGCAESLPFEDGSQRVVLMQEVLEHVDSVFLSLGEAYRVLSPGGVLFIHTTNRLRFSPTGDTQEFRIPFFNWLPDILKECYVFQHLHYNPLLANFTPRPAVHWFTYSDLCRAGRNVGFAQFYSMIDLAGPNYIAVQGSRLKTWLLEKVKYRPWLKALALTQFGGSIFMLKRL